MKNLKVLSVATVACSLLSTSAVLATEWTREQFAQAEVPGAVDDENKSAEPAEAEKKREKKQTPKKKDANEGQPPDEPRRPSKENSDANDNKQIKGTERERAKSDKAEQKQEKIVAPTKEGDGDTKLEPAEAEKPANVDDRPAPRKNAAEENAAEENAPAKDPITKPEAEKNKQPVVAPDRQENEKAKSPEPNKEQNAAPKDAQSPPPDNNDAPKAAAPAPDTGQPAAADPAPGKNDRQKPAATEVRDLKQVNANRKERSEDGGKRIVIEEPDERTIIKEDGRVIIRSDETERFRRLSRDTRLERRNGINVSVTQRPGGIQIFTDLDDEGRPLRRYRRGRDGRDVVLFDNRDYYKRHKRGRSFVDAIIELPPPRLNISRQQYIVDYDGASDDELFEALSAPPVEELEEKYALEEVRRSPMLRDRMRRVDLDTIKFEFGVWEVSEDQYPALERVARAINRVIERNPDEVFLIEGHTDAVGSDEDNLSLSDRRAESVAVLLTEEFQVPPENLTTQGYGEQYLKVQTDQAEEQNRRVAVRRITPLLSRSAQ